MDRIDSHTTNRPGARVSSCLIAMALLCEKGPKSLAPGGFNMSGTCRKHSTQPVNMTHNTYDIHHVDCMLLRTQPCQAAWPQVALRPHTPAHTLTHSPMPREGARVRELSERDEEREVVCLTHPCQEAELPGAGSKCNPGDIIVALPCRIMLRLTTRDRGHFVWRNQSSRALTP